MGALLLCFTTYTTVMQNLSGPFFLVHRSKMLNVSAKCRCRYNETLCPCDFKQVCPHRIAKCTLPLINSCAVCTLGCSQAYLMVTDPFLVSLCGQIEKHSMSLINSISKRHADVGLPEQVCVCVLQGGQIVDDELNQLLVNPLRPGVRLHCIIDACHSGSVLDLEYRAEFQNGAPIWTNEYRNRPTIYKVCPPPLYLCA